VFVSPERALKGDVRSVKINSEVLLLTFLSGMSTRVKKIKIEADCIDIVLLFRI